MSQIAWWPYKRDLRGDSIRLRAVVPMQTLRARGLDVGWFDPDNADGTRLVILGKRYDHDSLSTVITLQQRGIKVALDLCDNHFYNPTGKPEWSRRAESLRAMVQQVDHVIASTPALADVVAQESEERTPVNVIGDPADQLELVPSRFKDRWLEPRRQDRFLKRLQALRADGHCLLVWFGNHGVPYADGGMLDLLALQPILERLHSHHPIALTIISNSREKYEQSIRPWAIPTLYADWHALSFEPLMQAQDIALIPVGDNLFTRCKTDNRVASSLRYGLAVVADPVPSYLPYADCIRLGDWEPALSQLVTDAEYRRRLAASGQQLARARSAPETIADQWQALFEQLNVLAT